METISKDQAILSTVYLYKDGKAWKQYEIVSNIEAYGLNPQDLLNEWINRKVQWRRKKFSAESFCAYVHKKINDGETICLTKSAFDQICKQTGYVPEIQKQINNE